MLINLVFKQSVEKLTFGIFIAVEPEYNTQKQ